MRIAILLFFLSFFQQSRALDAPGYIIQLSGDTVKGFVDISTVHEQMFGKLVIDYPTLETQIKFSEGGGKKKKLDEKAILGFGFIYGGEEHHFVFLDLKKDKVKQGTKLGRDRSYFDRFFVRRTGDGYLTVFKHYFAYERTSNQSFMKENYWWVGQVYVKHPELGYIDIAPVDMSKWDFKKFLVEQLKLEEEFVSTIPKKKDWDQAEEVLKSYNTWKKEKK